MNSDDKLDRIEQTLRRAHQGIAAPDPGPLFTSAVMARITSQQDTEGTGRGAAVLCDRILLPFACSCAGFALGLAVYGVLGVPGVLGITSAHAQRCVPGLHHRALACWAQTF